PKPGNVPLRGIGLQSDSGAVHASPLRRESIVRAGLPSIFEPTVRAPSIRRGCDRCSQWEVLKMRLSAPIYQLRRKARLLSREARIPLHEALDRIAAQEGCSGWSLLAARVSSAAPASKLFARLSPGDLLLVAARPGHGKTLMSLELAVETMKSGNRA